MSFHGVCVDDQFLVHLSPFGTEHVHQLTQVYDDHFIPFAYTQPPAPLVQRPPHARQLYIHTYIHIGYTHTPLQSRTHCYLNWITVLECMEEPLNTGFTQVFFQLVSNTLSLPTFSSHVITMCFSSERPSHYYINCLRNRCHSKRASFSSRLRSCHEVGSFSVHLHTFTVQSK